MFLLKRSSLLPILLLLGLGASALPARAQALLPYTLPLDHERLQADGLRLAEDASQLAQFQQYDEALARAQLAAQLAPNSPQILALLGSLYLQVQDAESAIDVLERSKRLDSSNSLVWFALGSAHFSEGNYLQSANSLERGLSLDPGRTRWAAASPGCLLRLLLPGRGRS